jgi:F0F1-type ATP synthase assembly protein I
MSLASSVTTIALEMVVPAVIGLWIDERLGVSPLFVAAGAVLGLYVGIRSLLALTAPKPHPPEPNETDRVSRD